MTKRFTWDIGDLIITAPKSEKHEGQPRVPAGSAEGGQFAGDGPHATSPEREHYHRAGVLIDDLINAHGADWFGELVRLNQSGKLDALLQGKSVGVRDVLLDVLRRGIALLRANGRELPTVADLRWTKLPVGVLETLLGKGQKFDEGQHPRDDAGRFTDGGGASEPHVDTSVFFARLAHPDGGFTVSAVTGEEPSGPGNYAVSPYPEAALAVPVDKLTPKDLAVYVKNNLTLLTKDQHYFGGWHDPATHTVYLDVSQVVKSPEEAAKLAKDHQQLAYFDFGTGHSVNINPSKALEMKAPGKAHLVMLKVQTDAPDYEQHILTLFSTLAGRPATTAEAEDLRTVLKSFGVYEWLSKPKQKQTWALIAKEARVQHEPDLERTLRHAWKSAASGVSMSALRASLGQKDWDKAATVLQQSKAEAHTRSAVEPRLASAFLRGGKLAHDALLRTRKAPLRAILGRINPHAAKWAEERAGELVVGTDALRLSVQSIVEDAVADGMTVDDTAELLKEVVGLDPRRAMAAANYARDLFQASTPSSDLRKLVDEYIDELRTNRAETIARTEILMATNAGQQALWDEADAEGHLDNMGKVWINTMGCCDECDALGQDDPVGIDEPFDGDVMFPPLHPNCRCAMGLVKT
jgi:hypothetical protein